VDNFALGPDILRISDLVDIVEDLKITGLLPLIVHSFDTARISSAIYERIFGDQDSPYMYLSGLFHDLGLIVFSEIKISDGIVKVAKTDFSEEGEAFDIEEITQLDTDNLHQLFTGVMVRKMGILPDDFVYAMENHHTSFEKLEDGKKGLLANILNVSDMMAVTLRKCMKYGLPEAIKSMINAVKRCQMFDEVKKASLDFLKSPLELGTIVDEDVLKDKYREKMAGYINLNQFMEFLKPIVLMVDIRSPFTLKHSSAIASLARDLARELFKNESDAKILYMAGLVHDIGKLRTPIGILHKPGKLGEYEMYIMKLHVVETYKILSKHPEIMEIATIASLHHERLDGSGYPWGLSGNDIGMRARLLQIADVYIALTEDRPYRKSFKPLEALSMIEDGVNGGKLDPVVYEVLRTMVKNNYRIEQSDILIFDFFEEFSNIDFVNELLQRIS